MVGKPPLWGALVALASFPLISGCITTSSGGHDRDGGTVGGQGDGGTGGDAGPGSCDLGPGALAGNLVRIVYLVPSDKQEDPRYTANLEQAAHHLELWLRDRMPQKTSFLAHRPPVEVVQTTHPASYYASNPDSPCDRSTDPPTGDCYWYYNKVLDDAFALTQGSFDDKSNVWLYYMDADPACGQATGWNAPVGVLTGNDLRGMVGDTLVPSCDGDTTDPQPRCRWVGGMGVFLMGVLAVPVPAGCTDADDGTPCDDKDLTWLGYLSYPDATLSKDGIQSLTANPFMRAIGLPDCQLDCTTPVEP